MNNTILELMKKSDQNIGNNCRLIIKLQFLFRIPKRDLKEHILVKLNHRSKLTNICHTIVQDLNFFWTCKRKNLNILAKLNIFVIL